jgi:hypothetical protein
MGDSMGWISVEEGLPEFGVKCAFYGYWTMFSGYSEAAKTRGYMTGEKRAITATGAEFSYDVGHRTGFHEAFGGVTHWCPLPCAPEDQKPASKPEAAAPAKPAKRRKWLP